MPKKKEIPVSRRRPSKSEPKGRETEQKKKPSAYERLVKDAGPNEARKPIRKSPKKEGQP
jgi:hypothetical protein